MASAAEPSPKTFCLIKSQVILIHIATIVHAGPEFTRLPRLMHMKIGEQVEQLVEIMATLRAPEGCPWDREQTLDSLRPFLLEETYEVLDAMTSDNPQLHAEELGDLLFQIVFQSQIRSEAGSFDLGDVAEAISAKLRRRHPHVFGNARTSPVRKSDRTGHS